VEGEGPGPGLWATERAIFALRQVPIGATTRWGVVRGGKALSYLTMETSAGGIAPGVPWRMSVLDQR